jgi:hypothetical protein
MTAKTLDVDATSITDLKAMWDKLTPAQRARASKSIEARRAHRHAMDSARAKGGKKKSPAKKKVGRPAKKAA